MRVLFHLLITSQPDSGFLIRMIPYDLYKDQ